MGESQPGRPAKSVRSGQQGERERVFIALAVPDRVTERIAAWQRAALTGDLRPIGPGGLHVTLSFLGDRDAAEIDRAGRALRAAAAGHGPIPASLGPIPIGLPRRRPRAIAFAVEGATIRDLQADLVAELRAAGLSGTGVEEARRYRPHLTVARVRGSPRDRSGSRFDVADLAPLEGRGGHTFDVVRVALYRSELRSQGARYSVLADVELPQESGG